MTSTARRKLLRRDRSAVYHLWNRCVRQAYLCGRDPATGQDYSHRRDWIVNRERQLAGLFAIEVEFHAEMSNHLHLMLRTRPEIARRWSRHEVARRWLTITRLAKCMDDALPEPQEKRVNALAKDKQRIAKLRRRLSNVSWFMGILCENIARRANAEEDRKGKFFESRFRCRECADTSGILLCALYVDLNPIKAGEAASPRTARYTSAYQRMQAQSQRCAARHRADAWLGELTYREGTRGDATIAYRSRTGRRASDLGLLPISLESYLKLLEWTARQLRSGQRSLVPKDLESVLDHLQINQEVWVETLVSYETAFCHVVGSEASMQQAAQRMGVRCLKGARASRQVFV